MKKPKFLLLTCCLLPFLVTKGSGVLAKKVNETQVSKTVFGHLNMISLDDVNTISPWLIVAIHDKFVSLILGKDSKNKVVAFKK